MPHKKKKFGLSPAHHSLRLSPPKPPLSLTHTPAPSKRVSIPHTFYFGPYDLGFRASSAKVKRRKPLPARPYEEVKFADHPNWKTLPEWYDTTPVAEGGFSGPIAERQNIYDLYGTIYDPAKRDQYPPGWFGHDASGQPIAFAPIYVEGKAHAPAVGDAAVGLEATTLSHYPYLDKPPGWDDRVATRQKYGNS